MERVGDVLIVGGGPVGMLTALALAQEGIKVTVVEGEDKVPDSPRATVYFASTIAVLDELGILPDVQEISYVIDTFAARIPDFAFVARIPTSATSGVTYDYNLSCGQHLLAGIATTHARALGAEVRFGHRVTALREDGDLAVATVDTVDGSRELAAPWIIAADGARSTARRLLGIDFEGMTWPNRFVATNLACDLAEPAISSANFICDPEFGGVIARIDVKPHWRVTYQEDASLPAETYLERMPAKLARLLPEGVDYDVLASSPYAIHQRAGSRLRQGRVLLAGDAAHATNPLGGLGLTTGIWDGMVLADVLPAVIRGEIGDAVLDRYSDERRRVFWEVTSPSAVENKRIVEESDPEKRKADMAGFQMMADNPEMARMMMLYPFKVIGDVLREGSRWADADPTPKAGIDLGARKSQVK